MEEDRRGSAELGFQAADCAQRACASVWTVGSVVQAGRRTETIGVEKSANGLGMLCRILVTESSEDARVQISIDEIGIRGRSGPSLRRLLYESKRSKSFFFPTTGRLLVAAQ